MNLFPILLTFILSLIFFIRQGLGRRESLLAAMLVWGVGILFFTEILSALGQINGLWLLLGWWVGALGIACLLFIIPPRPLDKKFDSPLDLSSKVFLGGAILVIVILFFQALCIAPNSWDGMTYHLSRVEHWVQNKTIAYYPTTIIRQDAYIPFTEWILLHLRILTGTDNYYNLVEFLSMIVSAAGISLIARWLGAKAMGQSLSVLLVICLPMGMLQSTSTQTDYVITLWIIIFVYFLLRSLKTSCNFSILLSAAGLGLACLTKGYASFYAFPFLIYWLFAKQSRPALQRIFWLAFIIIVAVLFNAGYFYRNYCAFGHILWAREYLTNGIINGNIFIANVLRNIGLHLVTFSPAWNERVASHLQSLAAHFHIDLNPVEGTFGGMLFSLVYPFHESYAGNFVYSLLLSIVLITAIIYGRRRPRMAWFYIICLITMFILLCLVLRFQPFGSRFHLCIFVLSCAWTALIMEELWPRRIIMAVAFLIWAGCLPWLVLNYNKPLKGEKSVLHMSREDQYFISDPAWEKHMLKIADQLRFRNCRDIGFIGDENSKEYFLWAVLRQHYKVNFRIEHVDVPNITGKLSYPLGNFNPCAVVSMYYEDPALIVLPGDIYIRTWQWGTQVEGDHHSAIYEPLISFEGVQNQPHLFQSIHDYIDFLKNSKMKAFNDPRNMVFSIYKLPELKISSDKIPFNLSEIERHDLIAYLDQSFKKDFEKYEKLSYQFHHGEIWESDYTVSPAIAKAYELRQILTTETLTGVKQWPKRGDYNPYNGREGTRSSLRS